MTSKDDLHGAKYIEVDSDAASIIEAALVHVPFDGWGQAALNAGAADAGLTADDVARLFPSGALDAIVMHSAMADAAMVAAFEGMPDRPDRIHLMVRQMILIRLDQAAPHKEAVRRGLAILAVPGNALASARALYATVDAIWRAAGQTDTDISSIQNGPRSPPSTAPRFWPGLRTRAATRQLSKGSSTVVFVMWRKFPRPPGRSAMRLARASASLKACFRWSGACGADTPPV